LTMFYYKLGIFKIEEKPYTMLTLYKSCTTESILYRSMPAEKTNTWPTSTLSEIELRQSQDFNL